MHHTWVAVLARQAGSINRQTSRRVLGGALVALAALPLKTGAGKKTKACRKRVKNGIKKTCAKQVAQCEAHFAVLNPGKIVCCQHLQNCDFDGHIQCVV